MKLRKPTNNRKSPSSDSDSDYIILDEEIEEDEYEGMNGAAVYSQYPVPTVPKE
jgi:hypothetical protein